MRKFIFIVLVSACAVAMEKEPQKQDLFTRFFSSWAPQKKQKVNQEQEEPKKFEEPPKDGICYLELLPAEIQDHIASYLVFRDKENDQEFIERTSLIEEITYDDPDLYNEYKGYRYRDTEVVLDGAWNVMYRPSLRITRATTKRKVELYSFGLTEEFEVKNIVSGASPSFSKVVLAQNEGEKTNIKVFNVSEKTRSNHSLSSNEIVQNIYLNAKSECKAVGISNDGTWMACLINIEPLGCALRLKSFTDVIKNRQLYIKIISVKNPDRVVFNKQGTKVILRNNSEYEIIRLCDEAEHKQKSEKTLADYFRQRGICKNLLCRTESEDNL